MRLPGIALVFVALAFLFVSLQYFRVAFFSYTYNVYPEVSRWTCPSVYLGKPVDHCEIFVKGKYCGVYDKICVGYYDTNQVWHEVTRGDLGKWIPSNGFTIYPGYEVLILDGSNCMTSCIGDVQAYIYWSSETTTTTTTTTVPPTTTTTTIPTTTTTVPVPETPQARVTITIQQIIYSIARIFGLV